MPMVMKKNGQSRCALGLVVALLAALLTPCVCADDSNFRIWGSPSFSGSIQSDDVVVEVAAGFYYTVPLLEDGSLRCWGSNLYGQCDAPAGVGDPGN